MNETPMDMLVRALARLPGLGRRSAERAALALARQPETLSCDLSAALSRTRETVCLCAACGALTTRDADPCRLCADPARQTGRLCVVEDAADILSMERAGGYDGRYHALQGRLSPARRSGPQDIRLRSLVERVTRESVQEVILALSTDMEGDAASALIVELLRPLPVRVSRLAFGLPVDSGVGYADPVTLRRALSGRLDLGDGRHE